jgi:DNA-binding CsgD family transcriptional regulator
LAGALSPHELAAVVGQAAVDEALEDRVLTIEGNHVRAAHPLLAAVARARSRRGERRDMHGRLALVLEDEPRRALHVANGALGADPEVAATVGAAAALAARRGASSTAAELGEAALHLTPRTDPAYGERLLDAADYLWRAGELTRCADLVRPAIEWLPAGALRARALHVLATSDAVDSAVEHVNCLRRALAEAPPYSWLRVEIQTRLASNQAVGMVQDVATAEALADEAFAIANVLEDGRQRTHAAATLIWTRNLRDHPLKELARYPVGVHDVPLYDGVDRALAVGRMWRGEIVEARAIFESLLGLADERGEGEAYFALRVQLCELELRSGRLDIVAGLLDEWAREAPEPVGHQAGLLRFSAMLAAQRGDPIAAAAADEAVACADRVGIRWHALEARRARGLAALMKDDVEAACASLGEVDEYLRREGVENPGAFPLGPDYVEALVRAARIDEARAVVTRLSGHVEHPWADTAAARALGHVLLGEGDTDGAVASFADAAERCARLELRFDLARSLLAKGRAERQLRRKRDARASLAEAARVLATLGADGWVALAEAEAARIGGRQRSNGGLTATERRVADLVCQGLTNKQIAAALVVTVGSVEAHLTRIYAKLQIRSRTDLVRVLSAVEPGV